MLLEFVKLKVNYVLLFGSFLLVNAIFAEQDFRSASEIRDSGPTLRYLASALENKGDINRAIKIYRKLVRKDPKAETYIKLSNLYLQQGDKDKDASLSKLEKVNSRQFSPEQSDKRLGSLVKKVSENQNSHIEEEMVLQEIDSVEVIDEPAQSDFNNVEAIHNTASVIQRNNRRPDDQFTFDLFGRPLTIGGELELSYRNNVSLDSDDNNYKASIAPSLTIEFLYQISDSISLFADGTVFYSKEYGENEKQDADLERGQSWLLFEEIFDTNFDFKIGSQYFSDERTWWWDKVLDGISVEYFGDDWEGEISITQAMLPLATQDNRIEPSDKNLSWLLARLSLEFAEDHWIELFYTLQHDHSYTEQEGDIINVDQEDDTDADVHWLGLRANGTWETDREGEFDYWLDLGYMYGEETTIETSEEDGVPGSAMVEEVKTGLIRGWAFDAGLKWHTEWLLDSTITLGYAIGSGELDEDGSLQYAYRQTGIGDNSDFFGDVNYISYYGELLVPELSNLRILTLGISIPLDTQTGLDIVYHKYDQYERVDFIQGVDLNIDPGGTNTDIGQEIDITLGIRGSKNWEIELVGSIFKAGNAYEEDSGKIFSGLSFQYNYNF